MKLMKEKIMLDLKERFFNYESFKGLMLLGNGALTMYIALFHQQYIIQALGVSFGAYLVIEGLRKTFVNRVKLELSKQELINRRKKFDVSNTKN